MQENKLKTRVFGGASECSVGTHILCSLGAECVMGDDLVYHCECFCVSAGKSSNDMQMKINLPSPSLDKSRSFKEEVCLVGKADMYRGGCI